MTNRNWGRVGRLVAPVIMMLAAAIASPAQTFTTLVSFDGTNGAGPRYVSLVQGTDGNLYGTTSGGQYWGTVFKVTPAGDLTTLYNFCVHMPCADGASPEAGLVLGTDENFYGTAMEGGTSVSCFFGCGTVYKITRTGVLSTLHSFASTDGANPTSALIQATDGNLYGTTTVGGANNSCNNGGPAGCGTIFKITPGGAFTTIHSFDSADGANPYGPLIQGIDGNLYGTTTWGGANGYGTVFRLSPGGKLTTLHSFRSDCSDGAAPVGGLLQATGGNFYGTTGSGGAFGGCGGYGTIFKITPGGTLTTVHSFDFTDGFAPTAALVQAMDGNLYGTTSGGGSDCGFAGGCGTVFRITHSGVLTSLHQFGDTQSDGSNLWGGLNQATNGTFYGTAEIGGTGSDGTIYSETADLGPFIVTLPTAHKVGQRVAILGTNLTGTTSVSFNRTPATFTVVSSTEIATTVPSGATTGPVQVTTPSGVLMSNVPFRVMP